MAGQLLRLTPNVSSSWYWYPKWEERVIAFNREHLQEFTQQQNAILIESLRQRWINTPILAGYWLAIDDNKVVGHAVCWMAEDFRRPNPFVYQVESDPGFTDQWLADMKVWEEEFNQYISQKAPQAPLSEFAELATFRDPKAMKRHLEAHGAKNVRIRHLLRFEL